MKRSNPRNDGRGNSHQRRRVSIDENSMRDAVKVGQRASPEWKEAWCHWCDSNGASIYDPAKYEANKLTSFFAELGAAFNTIQSTKPGRQQQRTYSPPRQARTSQGTGRSNVGTASTRSSNKGVGRGVAPSYGAGSREMVEFVKLGQKAGNDFKEMWKEHCDTYGGGTKDPNMHSDAFFTSFLFRYGVSEIGAQDWAKDFLGQVSAIASPYIISAIKAGQREDQGWKDAWADFCNERASEKGTLDPTRQDSGSLFEFMETVAMDQFGEKPWMELFLSGVPVAEPIRNDGRKRMNA